MSYWGTRFAPSSISEEESSDVPEAITVSSFSTGTVEDDECSLLDDSLSLSSSRHSPSSSQRSIFSSYWNSPRHNSGSRPPLALEIYQADAKKEEWSATATAETMSTGRPTRSNSADDTSITYHAPNAQPKPVRRRILPAPPRQLQSSSSSRLSHLLAAERLIQGTKVPVRKWRSESELGTRSCLRSSGRYASSDDSQQRRRSLSCILHSDNSGEPDAPLARSVSFHIRVDVYEFVPPREQPAQSEGWRSYFA